MIASLNYEDIRPVHELLRRKECMVPFRPYPAGKNGIGDSLDGEIQRRLIYQEPVGGDPYQ